MNIPDGSAFTVGAHRALVAYNPGAIPAAPMTAAVLADKERVVPLLRALSPEALRDLAAWCAEELDTRQP